MRSVCTPKRSPKRSATRRSRSSTWPSERAAATTHASKPAADGRTGRAALDGRCSSSARKRNAAASCAPRIAVTNQAAASPVRGAPQYGHSASVPPESWAPQVPQRELAKVSRTSVGEPGAAREDEQRLAQRAALIGAPRRDAGSACSASEHDRTTVPHDLDHGEVALLTGENAQRAHGTDRALDQLGAFLGGARAELDDDRESFARALFRDPQQRVDDALALGRAPTPERDRRAVLEQLDREPGIARGQLGEPTHAALVLDGPLARLRDLGQDPVELAAAHRARGTSRTARIARCPTVPRSWGTGLRSGPRRSRSSRHAGARSSSTPRSVGAAARSRTCAVHRRARRDGCRR